jgi:hypothetical protein
MYDPKILEMNFELKKIIWAEDGTPTQPQTMSLRYRKVADPDEESSYVLVSDGLLVLESGAILNAPSITGLADNTSYVFRLTSYADETVTVDVNYTTPDEEEVHVAPEVYYPNSRVEVVDENANFNPSIVGAYYSLRNSWVAVSGTYGKLQTNSQVFTRAVADGYGFYIPANLGEMYIEGMHLRSIINNVGGNAYGLGIEFCMTAIDNTGTGRFPLISCMDENGVGVFVYVDLATKKVYWEHTSATLKETLVSAGTVSYGQWNRVAIQYPPVNGEGSVCTLYLNGDSTSTGTMSMTNSITNASTTALVNIGTTQYNKAANAGKGYFRNLKFTYSPLRLFMEPIINPPKLVIVMTRQEARASGYVVPATSVISEENTRIAFNIPETISAGLYDVTVEYGDAVTAPKQIVVYAFDKVNDTRVLDFQADEYAVNTFRSSFYLVSQGFAGAEGGVAAENVYIRNGLLTLEAHGDGYTGTLQGFNPDGTRKSHLYAQDPKFGTQWITRVGAMVASKEYYGYGSFRVQARLPKELGVVPTFFVSHKCITKAQEPFANELGGKGLRANGGKDANGIYIDMRQEFSMQMPTTDSHNTFDTMDDVLNAGFIRPVYLLGLDYLRVSVVNDPDPANNGTWDLTKPADRKLLSGWTKVSDTPHLYNQPFNNYVRVTNRMNNIGMGNGITTEPANIDSFITYMLPAAGLNIWDGEFHEFRMDWESGRVDYYIDGVMIRRNNQYVPWIPGRFGMALLFPTEAEAGSSWKADEAKMWGGKAPWHHQQMDIRRIEYIPSAFGAVNRLIGETFPLKGMREY